jgi:hypothetical protein
MFCIPSRNTLFVSLFMVSQDNASPVIIYILSYASSRFAALYDKLTQIELSKTSSACKII